MDPIKKIFPIKLDDLRNKSRAELTAQLEKLKAELKELREERSLMARLGELKVEEACASEIERSFLAEARKMKLALQEAYSNRKPPTLRLNSRKDPCCTAASPSAFFEDGEEKEE